MGWLRAVLSDALDWLDERRFLPYAEEPPPRAPAERRRWLALCLATWATMAGPVIAALPLIEDRVFLIKIASLLAAAFPFTYLMHFTSFPRFWINWATFLAATATGYFEMSAHWPPGGGSEVPGLILSYRVLVCVILWVMAFRAFALRDIKDLAQSAIPAASAVLLILIASPSALGLGGTAMMILGTLALLAGEQRATRLKRVDEIVPQSAARGGRWSPALNSWLALSLAVAIAGAGIALGASRMELSSQTGRWLRAQLAWRLAKLMIRERAFFAPERVLPLGGPAPPSRDRILLTVRGDAGLKMRCAVYEVYDGTSWRQRHRKWNRLATEGVRWTLPPLRELGLSPDAVENVKLEVRSYTYFGGYLPAPWCVRDIEFEIISLRHDYAGAVSMGGYFGPGDSYRAVIAVPRRPTPGPNAPEVPAVGVEEALQLPEELPRRVRDLAERITAAASAPQAKALAIQGYLHEHCEYDLKAPELPEGADFVDTFLFESRRGYCNHYSSALAVLCRAAGVPARLAVGFTAGRYDEERDLSVIRDQDAHSWVELFIPRVGWVDFDPTPMGEVGEKEAVLWRLVTGAATTARRAARVAGAWLAERGALLAVALLTLAATVLTVRQTRRWWQRRPRLLRAAGPAGDRVTQAYRQATEWLALSGLPRQATAAPWEFWHQVEERLPRIAQDLGLLTEKYLRARFGRVPPTEPEAEAVLDALERLRDSLFG